MRINKYDNLKGIAILMILFWHFDFTLKTINPYIYKIFYLTALPIFFFVSGYFSKIGPDEPLKNIKRLLIPYIVFCTITHIFNFIVFGKTNVNTIYLMSSFALWFILALFFMKMSLPVVDKLRYPLIISIICALIVGNIKVSSNFLGLTRCLAYFPIFLVGFYYKQYREKFELLLPKIKNFIDNHTLLIFITLCILTLPVIIKFNLRVFSFQQKYNGNISFEIIKRFITIMFEIAWVLMLNKIMTNKNCFLTKFGRNSMSVYLLHCYIALLIQPYFPIIFANHRKVAFVVIILLVFTSA